MANGSLTCTASGHQRPPPPALHHPRPRPESFSALHPKATDLFALANPLGITMEDPVEYDDEDIKNLEVWGREKHEHALEFPCSVSK